MRVGALAWMRVFTVSRGCTATAEALIAAAPAAAWPANTLSPSGFPPPPTIAAAAWKAGAHPPGNGAMRRRGGLGEGEGRRDGPRSLNEGWPSHRKQPISLMGGTAAGPGHRVRPCPSHRADHRTIGRPGHADASPTRVQLLRRWWCRRTRLGQRSNRPRRPVALAAIAGSRPPRRGWPPPAPGRSLCVSPWAKDRVSPPLRLRSLLRPPRSRPRRLLPRRPPPSRRSPQV